MYLGETGWKFECRVCNHKHGEGKRTTNSLYARHFIEENHKFVNLLEDYEILKVVSNTVKRVRNIERKKGLENLMNTTTK